MKSLKVLLVEPGYRNKYPPLGLMKIAAFHKERGDNVSFVKGFDKNYRAETWDRIYISTLFSFYWSQTIKAIKYYEFSVENPQNLFIGGPMASIMAFEIEKETGFRPVMGLLNEKGKLKIRGEMKIDSIVPDYSILNEINYDYPASDAYFAYMTRGCIRQCPFCSVPQIEPKYVNYIPLKKQIKTINDKYGEKKDLLLLDNNVLASSRFNCIIDEIKKIGFSKGAKLNNRNRYVDFNQGLDLRLLTKDKVKKLAELPIKPLRIAFDHIKYKKQYIQKIEWAAEFGIRYLSNYILYNYKDTPESFYERLLTNIELNERIGTKIFSFPMKYIPTTNKDRTFIGRHWNRKYLRSIQCILNATHGIVGSKRKFFKAAFGKNINEFKKLLLMPDKYIIYREKHKNNGAADWNRLFRTLSSRQKALFHNIVFQNQFKDTNFPHSPKVKTLLTHYEKYKKTDQVLP